MTLCRRHVLYIPGFDPNPPRSYRERYRREAQRQAEISGYEITQSPWPGKPEGWQVSALIEGQRVETQIEVLVWSDLVAQSMRVGIFGTYRAMLRTAAIYIGSGALFRMMHLRKGPVLAALYPVAVLLGQALLALGLWLAAAWLWLIGSETALDLIQGPEFMQPGFLARGVFGLVVLGPLAAWLYLRRAARRDGLLAWYLMKDYAFAASERGAYPPALEARLARFRERVRAAQDAGADEVLVVGHSSGAYLAVSVLADLMREDRVHKTALLTLGHVVPMVSFLPEAHRLRRDLASLGRGTVPWVDISAPGDGCTFALCDPVAVTGVRHPHSHWPLVLSAAFTQNLSNAAQAHLKWRFFERHFQYLNAFDALPDRLDAYDYFRVTAGPTPLWERFRKRRPSASRIETPVNRHTGTAP